MNKIFSILSGYEQEPLASRMVVTSEDKAQPPSPDTLCEPSVLTGPQDEPVLTGIVDFEFNIPLSTVDAVVNIRATEGGSMGFNAIEMPAMPDAIFDIIPKTFFTHDSSSL